MTAAAPYKLTSIFFPFTQGYIFKQVKRSEADKRLDINESRVRCTATTTTSKLCLGARVEHHGLSRNATVCDL